MTNSAASTKDLQAALQVARAAYEAIRDSGPNGIPSGHLYAAMGTVFTSLEPYEQMLRLLERSSLIERLPNHVLVAL